MSPSPRRARAAGLALGYLADVLWADPQRGHPVAAFGTTAAALERLTYRDGKAAGVAHTGLLLGWLGVLGVVVERVAARHGSGWTAAVTAAATYVVLGGTSLGRTGEAMAHHLDDGDVDAARALVPWLCGRDPNSLDEAGIARATVESVAENTADAQVAPLWWGAIGGVPGLLVYRGANTLDAMIGHRSSRYLRFGWAAARFDDVANYLPARVSGVLTAACAPVVSGSPAAALTAWRRDAARHPSPNAGVVEASFAGALGVRLGGPTQYAHRLEDRPTLGHGRVPDADDVTRSVRLSRSVQFAAAAVSIAVTGVGRTGRRASAAR
ncbi:cobalamin biosynthesis protein [Mycobacterium yunnanensis]|uniref:Cobalamin biosynthesis protein CobD n=1 Tax=Mycobacterium yunnanensis TaxID=368477 RepID=A0A9X2Z5V3_9MYCO|nr:cobalamin biosynthesis protein [Mycobacterium yunnanensis]MCV7423753.1 cobalamin biosynthesis protein [Mycobacterium yunnanensis]